jgi:hypothetical protein
MSLMTLFFLLLAFEMEKWGLVVLLAAFLTRDNTLILSLVVCFVAWRSHRKILFWGGLIVLFAGLAFESWFVHLGLPNRHHLPEFVFLALYVPCSFFGNVLGLDVWTNVGGADGAPWLHWRIPHVLQIGADHDVYVAFRWFRNFETLGALLTLFGCGPLLIYFLWKRTDSVRNWPLAVQIAIIYGLIAYFLGTSVGRTGTFRLVGYAWPAFWIALPYMFHRAKIKMTALEIILLAASSLLVAWIPNLEGMSGIVRRVTFWLLIIPAIYLGTAFYLRSNRWRFPRKSASQSSSTDSA